MADVDNKNIRTLVKEVLAIHLGLDPEDINDEDSLEHDLHMHASDFSDVAVKLEERKIETAKIDFGEIDTVSDLVDGLGGDEL